MAKKKPQRLCLGCGQMMEKRDMIRIVRDKENQCFLDPTGKQNGRGAYICRNAECFKKARKNKSLERSLKMQIPNEIYEKLNKELETL